MNRLEKRTYNYFNPSKDKILLVGDRPGPKAETIVPFCSDKFSGGWLNKQLENFDEDHLQWINAYDDRGKETSREDLEKRLPAKVVIALGGNASKWLKKQKVEHLSTFHPQFWKRFKNNERYPLIDIMRSYIHQ